MPLWTNESPPKWAPNAILTQKGWEDPATGEVLVTIPGGSETAGGASVASVSIISGPFHKEADNLDVEVKFNEAVAVSGTPQITVDVGGGNNKTASYNAGASSPANGTLVFRYAVEAAENAAAGTIEVDSPVDLNSGTIKDTNVDLADASVDSVTVTDGGSGFDSVPTLTVVNAPDTSGSGAELTAVLGVEDDITVTAGGSGYSSDPTVVFTGGGGTGAAATAARTGDAVTSVTVTDAGTGYTSQPAVSFSGGGGTGATADDAPLEIVSVTVGAGGTGYTTAPTVTVSGGNGTGADLTPVVTTAGDDAELTFTASEEAATIAAAVVDTDAPAVDSVALVVGSGPEYVTDEVIEFTVTFDEAVIVTGSPRIPIDIDGDTKYAVHVPATDPSTRTPSTAASTTHSFQYTVVAADSATATNVTVALNTLELNSGTINDPAGNASNLDHSAVDMTAVTVN